MRNGVTPAHTGRGAPNRRETASTGKARFCIPLISP